MAYDDHVSLSDALADLAGSSSTELSDDGSRLVALRHGDWRVAFRLTSADGRTWDVTEFGTLHDGGGLSGMEPLRRLPLGQLLTDARRLAGDPAPGGLAQTSSTARSLAPFLDDGRGRGSRPDRDLAWLAYEYVMLLQEGHRSPARAISEKVGGGSPQVWTDRITEARRRGLLTMSRPGVAGGELTEKALTLLPFADDPTDGELDG